MPTPYFCSALIFCLASAELTAAPLGEIIIEAESAAPEGFWKEVSAGGSKAMLWDAKHSNLSAPVEGQTLSYTFKTDGSKAQSYRLALLSGRFRSAFRKRDPGGDSRGIGDTRNNDVFVSILSARSNKVLLGPTRLFTGLHENSDQELWWGNSFDPTNGGKESWLQSKRALVELKRNTEYRLELSGRSDGYFVDRISLKSDAHLYDTRAHREPRRGQRDIPKLPRPSADQVDLGQYSLMKVWSRAGVEGGIPEGLRIAKTIDPGDDIGKAVRSTGSRRGAVLLLRKGTYEVTEPILMKSNVVIRGEDRKETRIEFRPSKAGDDLFVFSNTEYAGVENLTMEFCAPGGKQPPHKEYTTTGIGTGTSLVTINGKNNWVKSTIVLNSGSDPIAIFGSHNTMTSNYVEGAFNKAGGQGYYRVRGSHNLLQGETVKAVRHLGILNEQSHHNVVVDSYFETDINFHLGDTGNNLIEGNTVTLPEWHKWDIFASGGPPYGHLPPGNGNLLVNNYTRHTRGGRRPSGWSQQDIVYTYEGYEEPVMTSIQVPKEGRFYAPQWPSRVVVHGDGGSDDTYLEPDGASGGSDKIPSLRNLRGAEGKMVRHGDEIILKVTKGKMSQLQEEVSFYSSLASKKDSITGELKSMDGAVLGSRAGVMLRENEGAKSSHVSLMLAGDGSLAMLWRSSRGKTNQGLKIPLELALLKSLSVRLNKTGNVVTGEFSYDGEIWKKIKTVKVLLGSNPLKGLAVCSGGAEVITRFGNVTFD